MKQIIFLLILSISAALSKYNCQSAMTPLKIYSKLASLTKAKPIIEVEAQDHVESGKCRYIKKGRNYRAAVALTPQGDLKRGAKGIDEWVELDKGNSYVLTNYKWVAVGELGTSQLHLDFDTLYCTD